jgi:serine/threonine-protein kinase HipA
MAMLRKDHSEGTSYLELADILQHRGARNFISADLEQLFRRVVFNVAVGSRDDHLRNHGFLLTPEGARIVAETLEVTRTWRQAAAEAGITRADVEVTAAAFALSE